MRINRYIALATGMSRRAADQAILGGRVAINGQPARPSDQTNKGAVVTLDGKTVAASTVLQTILLNKPAGYVVSRDGQGSKTIYDLLPATMKHLKPIGRLDKDSSGLLLLTNDGKLAHRLTHPSFHKAKIYEVTLDQALQPLHRQMISDIGVLLDDGPSKLQLERLADGDDTRWRVTMHEGRNRQIRRTFACLGYTVTRLHRTYFGEYQIGDIKPGAFTNLS
ncbi:MAG TPA: pseudouridine synthase [Candidatus Saccharimonadales bacterium]|nr:pseudouridine synthase [Candidatus Saccharimonadales bacterium]